MAENNSVRQEAALAETVPKEQRKTSQRNGVKKSKEKDQESGKKWTWQEVAEKRKQQMKEITERLETGLKEYMTTDVLYWFALLKYCICLFASLRSYIKFY